MNKTNERIATWPLVETSWLAKHLDSSDLRIIDCSIKHQDHDSVRKYFSGKVEWGTLVNKDTHTYLSEKELRGAFNATDALKANSFITYCGGGVAASSDALALTLLGIQDVAVYHEGLIEWTADPELPMEVG